MPFSSLKVLVYKLKVPAQPPSPKSQSPKIDKNLSSTTIKKPLPGPCPAPARTKSRKNRTKKRPGPGCMPTPLASICATITARKPGLLSNKHNLINGAVYPLFWGLLIRSEIFWRKCRCQSETKQGAPCFTHKAPYLCNSFIWQLTHFQTEPVNPPVFFVQYHLRAISCFTRQSLKHIMKHTKHRNCFRL